VPQRWALGQAIPPATIERRRGAEPLLANPTVSGALTGFGPRADELLATALPLEYAWPGAQLASLKEIIAKPGDVLVAHDDAARTRFAVPAVVTETGVFSRRRDREVWFACGTLRRKRNSVDSGWAAA
jgi:hypothetical protein